MLKVQKFMERSLGNNPLPSPKQKKEKRGKVACSLRKDHCAKKDKNWSCLKREKKVFILWKRL